MHPKVIKLVTSMKQGFPSFALVFYLADWLFIVAVVGWLVGFCFSRKASRFSEDEDDNALDDYGDEEAEDQEALLNVT